MQDSSMIILGKTFAYKNIMKKYLYAKSNAILRQKAFLLKLLDENWMIKFGLMKIV